MKILKSNPVLALTIVGVLLREVMILAGVSYDSGGFRSILYFMAEGLSILVIAAGDLLDYVFSARNAAHYAVSIAMGLLIAFILDRLIGRLRARIGAK